jgi:hypothetical protein
MLKRSSLNAGLMNGLPRGAGVMAIFFLAIALALTSASSANAATFTASLDAPTVFVNESATLTLTFEGGQPTRLPTMPSVANLVIQGPNSQAKSTILAKGQMLNSYIFTYEARATKEGEYVIPALSAEVDGQVLKSDPVKLRVLPANAKPPAPTTAFLRLIVPKTNVFLGEVLPVEIQICFQSVNGHEAPQFKEEGFTRGAKMHQAGQNATIINNQRYNMVSFYTYIVPVKAGNIALGPATMPVQIPKPNGQVDFFGRPLEWQNVTLESQPQTLNVTPLPHDNVPTGFNGAVGSFALTVEASPTNVAVGDPVTVKIQVTGKGALDGVTLPAQPGWDQFKLYPPTSEVQITDTLGMTGTKTFKLTAVPQTMDIKELPAYVFSYFDPDQKAYRTLTQPAIALTLRPSAASLPPALNTPAAPGENAEATQNILSIKQRMGTLAQIQPPIAVRGWFIFAQFIPVLVWIAALVWRKNADRLVANPQLRRQRLVDRIVRDGLKKLKHAAQQNDAETFFATAFHLLQEQLGERLDRPASAITEAILDEPALAGRLPEETLAAMHDLFHTLNQARYAPQSTNAELVSLAVNVEDALNILKQLKA